MRVLKNWLWALLPALLLAGGGPAAGFKQGDPNSDRNHQDITFDGLTLVRPGYVFVSFSKKAIEQVEDQNANTDRGIVEMFNFTRGHFNDGEYHFDGESFSDSARLIVSARKAIIEQIRAGRYWDARRLLGQTLHTLQDFYAHSNWVEKRLHDFSYPHPAWTTDDPFGVDALRQPGIPGANRIDACSFDGVLVAAPLTTGYYDLEMSHPLHPIDGGAWTKGWGGVHPDWEPNRCVHGGDGHTHGLNKDYAERHGGRDLFSLARQHAAQATKDFVQHIVDQFPADDPGNEDIICAFLGQEASLCKQPTNGSVSTISTTENQLFAGLFFTVVVQGTDLSPFMRVELSGGGMCNAPRLGTRTTFEVLCVAEQTGSQVVSVKSAAGEELRALTVNILADGARASSLLAYVGQTVLLWAENLYATIKAAVWSIPDYANAVVAKVVNGMAETVSAVFTSPGQKSVLVQYEGADGKLLGATAVTIDVLQRPTITAVSASPTRATPGSPLTLTVVGMDLHAGLSLALDECGGVRELPNGDKWQTQFTCTFPPGTAPGVKRGTVASTINPLAGASSVLFEFDVQVDEAVATVSAVAPTSTIRTIATSFDITGQNLPTAGLAVTVAGDPRASCQAPNNLRTNGFGVACQLYRTGPQTLEVRQDGAVLGTVAVNVQSNVTGVTWRSTSTSTSGPVKFNEVVTFTVSGSNLTADPALGFAVEKCGPPNQEVGVPTASARQFTCYFNDQAGAVAGQMAGVVKDAPGGQVLLDGWRVPVEAAAVKVGLTDTGITSNQCYQAGSALLVGCATPAALSLNGQQDGMVGLDARASSNGGADGHLGLSYSELPGYARSDCVIDNTTGLTWEAKMATGLRAASKTFTNAGNGLASDASGYVAQVNATALCGFTDWRLPTAVELQGLMNYSIPVFSMHMDSTWFDPFVGSLTPGFMYWTATPWARDAGQAWRGNFDAGGIGPSPRGQSLHVRLVRGLSPEAGSPTRYTYSTDGSEVEDTQTGLIWRRCIEGLTWNGATCVGSPKFASQEAALVYAKTQTGWRVPNAKELTTLVDRARVLPASDPGVFPGNLPGWYWTSTPFIGDGRGFYVDFDDGYTNIVDRAASLMLRLVRDR